MSKKANILLIYTGGTIGMVRHKKTGELTPFNFAHLLEQVPEIKRLNVKIAVDSLKTPIDSSNMNPKIWKELGDIIYKNYQKFDGFVVLHGSDTMAFTASALSFMFQNLNKPIILTGSQLPIDTIRTDGKENLITAIEVASMGSKLSEVAIYFEYNLYRGNRTSKVNAEDFEAFRSYNYPKLAEAGVNIKINERYLLKPKNKPLVYLPSFNNNIGILKFFPGISKDLVEHTLALPSLKAIVLETYGAGNAPNEPWLKAALKKAIDKGLIVANVSQCHGGTVEQGKYETSQQLLEAGVIGCGDMTTEATVCKLMFLLANEPNIKKAKKLLTTSMCGEIS
jgi:L-asparaginase